MDIQTFKDIKAMIDRREITDRTDLILLSVNTNRLDIFTALHDKEIEEIFTAYIEKENSIYNKKLIKKYYEDLQNSLLY